MADDARTAPRRPARRRALLVVVAAVALFGLLFGCVSTVTPPPPPPDPVAVFLLHDDRHRLLAVRRAPAGFAVWSYGDWDWYAHNHDAWYYGFDTVLWPTQGTLARRFVPGEDEAAVRRAFPSARVSSLSVSRARVNELHARLEADFTDAGTPHLNRRYATSFVRCGAGFWFLHNCNDAVADWLRELDCDVSWVPVRLDLSVAAGPD